MISTNWQISQILICEAALGTDRPGRGLYLTDLTASVHWLFSQFFYTMKARCLPSKTSSYVRSHSVKYNYCTLSPFLNMPKVHFLHIPPSKRRTDPQYQNFYTLDAHEVPEPCNKQEPMPSSAGCNKHQGSKPTALTVWLSFVRRARWSRNKPRESTPSHQNLPQAPKTTIHGHSLTWPVQSWPA
jgi:hypothetical protein